MVFHFTTKENGEILVKSEFNKTDSCKHYSQNFKLSGHINIWIITHLILICAFDLRYSLEIISEDYIYIDWPLMNVRLFLNKRNRILQCFICFI